MRFVSNQKGRWGRMAAGGKGVAVMAIGALCLSVGGCRYGANRCADFRDIIQVGGGITAQNPETGNVPPSLGLLVNVTEYLNLGAVGFGGYTAEWDGRGLFCGPETRTRMGLGWYQVFKVDQDYARGCENYFKKADTLWSKRMNENRMRWCDAPAKSPNYDFYSVVRKGWPLHYRGWQYWENTGVEVGVCDPFLTHLGLNLRLGLDVSEVSDFLLGWFTIDFNQDDLNVEEYEEMTGMAAGSGGDVRPASD